MLKKIFYHFLIIFLVVQTLNLSINSLDFYTMDEISNSSGNQDYVDSMIEFVVENMLGYSKHTFNDKANADNFSKQQQNLNHFDLKCLPNPISLIDNHELTNSVENLVPQNDRLINLYFREVPAKPPQTYNI